MLYRVYTIDTSNRIVGPPTQIDSESDDDAIEKAKQLLDGHPIELWDRARMIVRLKPSKKESKRK